MNRQPAGVPTGGQFSLSAREEVDVLGDDLLHTPADDMSAADAARMIAADHGATPEDVLEWMGDVGEKLDGSTIDTLRLEYAAAASEEAEAVAEADWGPSYQAYDISYSYGEALVNCSPEVDGHADGVDEKSEARMIAQLDEFLTAHREDIDATGLDNLHIGDAIAAARTGRVAAFDTAGEAGERLKAAAQALGPAKVTVEDGLIRFH